MPSNFSDVQITESDITITSGLYDTDDGIKLQVVGDAEPRVHITPQGEIKSGDGTAAPTSGTRVHSATLEQITGAARVLIPDISGAYYVIDEFDLGEDQPVVFYLDDITQVGSFTALFLGLTNGGVVTYVATDGSGADATVIGPGPSSFPSNGVVIHAVNAGDGWVMAPSSSRTTADAADYDNNSSGLTATTVQAAIDELAALLP